jgi:Ras-related protein Rab-32
MNEIFGKVVVLGDAGVGKTSIIRRYIYNSFFDGSKATVGVDFLLKVCKINDDTTIRLQFWDIAGQERFGSMTKMYYRDANAAFIVFDVTNNSSLESVVKWKEDLDKKVFIPGTNDPIPVILLANKTDLLEDPNSTFDIMLNEFCLQHKIVSWFKISAKKNLNISEAMNKLIEHIRMTNEINNNDYGFRSPNMYPIKPIERNKKSDCCEWL